jgi:hypothetical protein
VSFRRPVASCPTYVEYFKDGDAVPGKRCGLHRGNLKEELRRRLMELLGALGRKLGERIQEELEEDTGDDRD